uniref:Transmembrane protein 186 n=1 Tax=Cacopsylla melanoneura TaxID=428564 RepID=A0A8D8WQ78_9HEMI
MLGNILLKAHYLVLKNAPCSNYSKLLFSVCSNQLFNKIPVLSNQQPSGRPIVDPDFKVIYRYPSIDYVRAISRSKTYALLANCVTVPVTYILELNDILVPNATLLMIGFGCSLVVSTSLTGLLLWKFVGIIYYNKKTDMVKIAYLTYMGLRADDVIPRTQLNRLKMWPYFPILSTISDAKTKKTYKISATNGIMEPLIYGAIFDHKGDEGKDASNSLEPNQKSLPPPSTDEVDFEELVKKIQADNQKKAKENKASQPR